MGTHLWKTELAFPLPGKNREFSSLANPATYYKEIYVRINFS